MDFYVFNRNEPCDFKSGGGNPCGEIFSSVEDYLVHIDSRHKVRFKQCDFCDPNHMFLNLKGHLKDVHRMISPAPTSSDQPMPGPSSAVAPATRSRAKVKMKAEQPDKQLKDKTFEGSAHSKDPSTNQPLPGKSTTLKRHSSSNSSSVGKVSNSTSESHPTPSTSVQKEKNSASAKNIKRKAQKGKHTNNPAPSKARRSPKRFPVLSSSKVKAASGSNQQNDSVSESFGPPDPAQRSLQRREETLEEQEVLHVEPEYFPPILQIEDDFYDDSEQVVNVPMEIEKEDSVQIDDEVSSSLKDCIPPTSNKVLSPKPCSRVPSKSVINADSSIKMHSVAPPSDSAVSKLKRKLPPKSESKKDNESDSSRSEFCGPERKQQRITEERDDIPSEQVDFPMILEIPDDYDNDIDMIQSLQPLSNVELVSTDIIPPVVQSIEYVAVAGPSRLAHLQPLPGSSQANVMTSKLRNNRGKNKETSVNEENPGNKNRKQQNEKWKRPRRRGKKKKSKGKKPHNKAAKCIFCKTDKVYENIRAHLKICSKYAEERAKPGKHICTQLRKDGSGGKRICGNESYSKADAMHHSCHVHRIVYSACNLCEGKPVFLDIKKHIKDKHLETCHCPFNCGYSCMYMYMNEHIRKEHADQIYLKKRKPNSKAVIPPLIENFEPQNIFHKFPEQFLTNQNKSFFTVYDRARRENVMSVSVLSKENLTKKVGKLNCGDNKFKYDHRLHFVQPAAHIARQLGCHSSHLECASHHLNDPESYEKTFLNSNLVYMFGYTNKGMWRQLEEHKNNLIKKSDYVVSINGVIHSRNAETKFIGGMTCSVPSHFYSIIYIFVGTTMKSQAFLIDNFSEKNDSRCLFHCITTLEEIQKCTGLKIRENFNVELTYSQKMPNFRKYNDNAGSMNGCILPELTDLPFVDCDIDDTKKLCFYNVRKLEEVPKTCVIESPKTKTKCGHPFNQSRKNFIYHLQHSHGIIKFPCDICKTPIVANKPTHYTNRHSDGKNLHDCPFAKSCGSRPRGNIILHCKTIHANSIGYIAYNSKLQSYPPSLSEISLNFFLDIDISNYSNAGGKFFSTYIDKVNLRTAFSISILKKDPQKNSVPRRNKQFKFDKALPVTQPTKETYRIAGYKLGHIESSGLYQFSKEAYNSTFAMSNMAYMSPNLNHSYYNSLDNHKRRLLNYCDYLISFTGLIYGDTNKKIPGGINVSIPDKIFNIILLFRDDSKPTAQAFMIDNNHARTTIFHCRSTFEDIENAGQIRFKPKFKDETEYSYTWSDSSKPTKIKRLIKRPKISRPKKFPCNMCKLTFSSKDCLYRHKVKAHKNIFPFVCPKNCGNRYQFKGKLKRHLVKCVGKNVCKNCNKSFTTIYALRRHLKYYCPVLKTM